MVQVKIGGGSYEALVTGRLRDSDWGGRESKSITLEMDYETAMALFQNNAAWSIRYQPAASDAETSQTEPVEYDNSAYCVAGDLTDHRDGTVTVKMGKLTELEETLLMIYGGEGE